MGVLSTLGSSLVTGVATAGAVTIIGATAPVAAATGVVVGGTLAARGYARKRERETERQREIQRVIDREAEARVIFEVDCEFMRRPITNRNACMIILGHSGSGKTSLVRRLHGEEFRAVHRHTETVEIHSSTINEVSIWQKLKFPKYTRMIREKLCSFFRSVPMDVFRSATEKSHPIVPPDQFIDLPTFIRVWDFAGDLEFYALQQLFLTRSTVYVVVVDLSRGLNDVADVRNGWTSREFVDYWFNCIYSCSKIANTHPRVMIVGTHKDIVGQERDVIERKFHQLKDMIRDQPYGSLLVEECFSIANNDEDNADREAITKKFLEVSESLQNTRDEIPLRFFALKDRLEEMATYGVHALSISGFEDICEELNLLQQGTRHNTFLMRERRSINDELKRILRYFHDSGDLIYYENLSMEKNIFLQPQWLANKCNDIMGFDPGSGEIRRQIFNFRRTGFISDATLGQVWRNDKDLLVELLQQFGLFIRHDRSSEILNQGRDAGEGYVCPVFLPVVELEYASFHYPPLVIQPADRFIPIGATSHIISEFILKHGWKVSSLSLHRGVLKPPVCNSLEILFEEVLLRKGQCFRMRYMVTENQDVEKLIQIRKQLEAVIKDVLKEKVMPGITCSKTECRDFIPFTGQVRPNLSKVTCYVCKQTNNFASMREWFITESQGGKPFMKMMEEPRNVKELIDQKTPDLMDVLEFRPRFVATLLRENVIDERVSNKLRNESDRQNQVAALMDHIRMDPVTRFINFIKVLKDPKLGQVHVLDLLLG